MILDKVTLRFLSLGLGRRKARLEGEVWLPAEGETLAFSRGWDPFPWSHPCHVTSSAVAAMA